MGADPTEGFRYYDDGDSAWWISLWAGGFEFTNPPPSITAEGIQPFPNRGARQLHSRTSFFYSATGITPAMCMRLTNVGSQYLFANVDRDGEPFDGAETYRLRLPQDIPAARFWSLTLYDNQTRSMLQTAQRYPRAGSQNSPSPAAEHDADGSTAVYFSPTQPDGVATGNWIQTDPDRGWFVILRLYSPLQPFFDHQAIRQYRIPHSVDRAEWRPSPGTTGTSNSYGGGCSTTARSPDRRWSGCVPRRCPSSRCR